MSRLPVLKPRIVCRALEHAGFVLRKSKGGHRIYVKERRHVTVPYHTTDIKPGTLASIETRKDGYLVSVLITQGDFATLELFARKQHIDNFLSFVIKHR